MVWKTAKMLSKTARMEWRLRRSVVSQALSSWKRCDTYIPSKIWKMDWMKLLMDEVKETTAGRSC